MNTLLVTVDALRADHVGHMGYGRPTTPALDAFADKHAYFSRAFANGTFTSAALPAIFTGTLRKDSAEPLTVDKNLQIREPNLVSVLQEEGVHTVGINTNMLIHVWYERIDGFDEFYEFLPEDGGREETDFNEVTNSLLDRVGKPMVKALGVENQARQIYNRFRDPNQLMSPTYHDAAMVTDKVVQWLNAWDGEPFFIWVHYMDPHHPYANLEAFSSAPLPHSSEVGDTSRRRIIEIVKRAERDPGAVTLSERELMLDLYDGFIRYFDDHLGRLFEALEEREAYDNTQIIVTADHGEEFGEHGQYFHYNRPYDELLHVPLVVKSPEVENGVHHEQVSHIDIAPTVLGGHGVPSTNTLGVSLGNPTASKPVLAVGSDRPYLDISSRPFAAVRYPTWKYIYDHERNDELYHLSEDPNEQDNVCEAYSQRARLLRRELLGHLRFSKGDKNGSIQAALSDEDDIVHHRLRDLGYME